MRHGTSSDGSRASALWGKGGRGLAILSAALFLFAVPLVANASTGQRGRHALQRSIAHGVRVQTNRQGRGKVMVIIQSSRGLAAAEHAVKGLGSIHRRLPLIDAISVLVPASELSRLASVPGLTITPDAPVRLNGFAQSGDGESEWNRPLKQAGDGESEQNRPLQQAGDGESDQTRPLRHAPRGGYSSNQVWPAAEGLSPLWSATEELAPQAPTIAVVDSGIDASRPDFGGRVVKQVELCSLEPCSDGGDGYGHGTFVASVAAGSAPGYAGAAPNAPLVSLHVLNDHGEALTSDVIDAAQWILANHETYNIRVANFSLHSGAPSNFTRDPLDQAVEKLWFSGVVVVTSAGNTAVNGLANRIRHAPGNDPFVITVGAADLHGTVQTIDDTIAPWSSWGYTFDGFAKPELSAAGRYIVGAIPPSSALATERAVNVVSPGYIRLSGTSVAASVVSGAAAQLLTRHPSWQPDQVKGALMLRARPLPLVTTRAGGVGELNAAAAARVWSPPNPNAGLDQFIVPDPSGGSMFDATGWTTAAKSNRSWNSASWHDAAWSSAAWSVVSWTDVSWTDVSWTDLSAAAVSWTDASWSDVSWSDLVCE
jgi:subtilisin family serine protease